MFCSHMNNVCFLSGYLESGHTSLERKREGLREPTECPGQKDGWKKERLNLASCCQWLFFFFFWVFSCGFAYFSFQRLTICWGWPNYYLRFTPHRLSKLSFNIYLWNHRMLKLKRTWKLPMSFIYRCEKFSQERPSNLANNTSLSP